MKRIQNLFFAACIGMIGLMPLNSASAQNLTLKYATLELFTNTPCPICGSSNPGMFSRLSAYEGQYHLISFYPGKPYSSCVFYQANVAENTARYNFYSEVFGSPTVGINGTQFPSSNGVTNALLDAVTGDSTWLNIQVEETTGSTRNVDITLYDLAGGSVDSARLFAVIVEKEIMYNAPNGENVHYNVFRKFLTNVNGEDIDLSGGMSTSSYEYTLDGSWQDDQVYIIAWLMNPETQEIYNSGTRFDPPLTTATRDLAALPKVKVFPNPATLDITIQLPEEINNAPIVIYDIHGKIVHQETVSGNNSISVDVSSLPVGFYQVGIGSSKGLMTGRFEVVR